MPEMGRGDAQMSGRPWEGSIGQACSCSDGNEDEARQASTSDSGGCRHDSAQEGSGWFGAK
jgi:hypothetical protein